jgi:hypothetical protein
LEHHPERTLIQGAADPQFPSGVVAVRGVDLGGGEVEFVLQLADSPAWKLRRSDTVEVPARAPTVPKNPPRISQLASCWVSPVATSSGINGPHSSVATVAATSPPTTPKGNAASTIGM